jgi:hypothetical protein
VVAAVEIILLLVVAVLVVLELERLFPLLLAQTTQ